MGASRGTGTGLSHLEGSASLRRYDSDQLAGTDPLDGKPLLARYNLQLLSGQVSAGEFAKRHRGLWRWNELLPVRDRSFIVSLGEGSTPLVPLARLARKLGFSDLSMKAESINPTGSFKARGMAVAVSRGVELGVRHFVAPSAGNAAGALAAYAAAAGVSATVVMPADAPLANQLEVVVCGSRLILLEGLISDCGRLARLISESTGAFDVATLREPYRLEGKKTLGFELAQDYEWRLPDVIIYPTGGGTGLIGMWKAFAELETLGIINKERPRMYCVQSDGCAPIVRAFNEGADHAQPWPNASTRAGGIRVPSALGDHLILDCLRESGGGAIAVPETEISRMQLIAARTGAGYLGLESSAALAALPILLDHHSVDKSERIVVFDTGAGFKSEPPGVDLPRPIPNDPDMWHQITDAMRTESA